MGLITTNPFDLVHAPRAKGVKEGRALSAAHARKLVTAAAPIRLGGRRHVVALPRLARERGARPGLGRPRSRGRDRPHPAGCDPLGGFGHHLRAHEDERHTGLRAYRAQQAAERLALGAAWPEHTYRGKPTSPVFTNTMGGLVNRQAITKVIQRAARRAGLDPAGLATHAGRRTVITALYAEGGLDLTDVARHVGHSNRSTTAGYVRSLGQRPAATARHAAELLDPMMIAE